MMAKTWQWLQIWLAIKPTLKCSQFGKYKAEYEAKIAEAEANMDGALAARAKVQATYDGLAAQKNELQLALKSGGSAVQDIIDKTVRIEGQAADVQKDLDGVLARIANEKSQKAALEMTIQKTNATVAQLEAEVGNQEANLTKAEQDRADKDDQIRTLKDEIGHQAEMITKLGKEKRSGADARQKTEEDIQAAEDKSNHLSRVKGKLEQALDEAEDALEREKKVKGDVDKGKRKVEGDLKLTQEALADLERVKNELQGAAARKDKEGCALAAKIDDEATLGAKYAKQAKELSARLEELLPGRTRKAVLSQLRLMMKPLWVPSMPNRRRNCRQDLKSLTRNWLLSVEIAPKQKRAAPCSRRILRISPLAWKRLAPTPPPRWTSTRREKQSWLASRQSLKS